MSSISISPTASAPHLAQTKPQSAQANPASHPAEQAKLAQSQMSQKVELHKSPQAGGNGLPTKPVSTSTKTVQDQHRINVKA